MRNIFLKKTYTKFIWTLFSESKLTISLDQNSEILCGLLLLYVQIEVYQNLLLPHNFFFFLKKGLELELVYLLLFLHDFSTT